ncbi:DUF4132 domain-containing protein [Serratia nematodiphila]
MQLACDRLYDKKDFIMPHATLLAQLKARLGEPPDISPFPPQELGKLWADIHRLANDVEHPEFRTLAYHIRQQTKTLGKVPAFDNATAIDVLRNLVCWEDAVLCIAGLTASPSPALATELRRILTTGAPQQKEPAFWALRRYEAHVLTRYTDDEIRSRLQQAVMTQHAQDPYVLSEFAVLSRLSLAGALTLCQSQTAYYQPQSLYDDRNDMQILSDEPAYMDFARTALEQALRHLGAIRRAELPYKADCAFSVDDAHIIARAARITAWRDERWFGPLIEQLLPQVAVAPTTAKTAPSQALAIALGHSIQAAPTPEGVKALRYTLESVRHAGIKKKLGRNVKPAERNLAERPDMALKLSGQLPAGKKQTAMLASCLEASMWLGSEFTYHDWHSQLHNSPAGAPLAHSLIWLARCPGQPDRVFVPLDGALDAHGQPLDLPNDAEILLWHPLMADEGERQAWRTFIISRRIAQPFRQAYREYYFRSADFSGYLLALRPLLGLARQQGWHIDAGGVGLARRFGEYQALFAVNAKLYPGADGWGASGALTVNRQINGQWERIAPEALPAITYSEMCRAADLLISRTALAEGDVLASGASPQQRARHLSYLTETSNIANLRRETLRHIFHQPIAAGRLTVETNHLRIADYALHLATGRVTRAGAPAELPSTPKSGGKSPIFWLPYDESILSTIVDRAEILLAATGSAS